VGSFRPVTATGSNTYVLDVLDVPAVNWEAYLFNNGTGQATGAWTLKVTPMTYGPV
jgi:hypothetical protein